MTADIEGYVYTGDVSVADYGGKWIGILPSNCGHIIEVVGMADLEDGDAKGAIIQSAQIYVSGHNAMRQAVESCGWDVRGIADRAQRRAMLLEAYHGYYGADVHADFGGPYELRVTDDDAAITQANQWAQS